MTTQIKIGDALDCLRDLPDGAARCCVTSPPYWGLRDYGVAGQLGLEPTPDEYVAKMVKVFSEVRRVLADDGTLWLNLGDSYARQGGKTGGVSRHWDGREDDPGGQHDKRALASEIGMKPKDLVGIPWRVAFALQADGWYLRSDIIWSKPNPMPESVTDRPTKAHEYVFLLSKSARYFYDADAIAEPSLGIERPNFDGSKGLGIQTGRASTSSAAVARAGNRSDGIRNARTVWEIATQPFKGSHFATMPPELAERCIKAGSAIGDTVLDPFGGAGTTGLVADRLGRDAILVELNPTYAALATNRISDDNPLFAEVSTG